MLCEEAESLFDAYLADALRDDVLNEREQHLAPCKRCSAKLAEAEKLLHETGSVLKWALPEAGFEDRVRERVAGATIMAGKPWSEVLREQWERAPWWMISAAVHAVVLMLMTIFTIATANQPADEIVILTDLAKKKDPEYDEKKIRDIFKNTKEVEADEMVENPVFVHEEVEVTDHFETENQMDSNTARGQEDAISDIPLGGTGVVGNIGVGGGGAGCFGYRTGGGRRKAVGKFGGSQASESAVEAALRWLAKHQSPDGRWETKKLDGNGEVDAGVTGLACLAFLGAGHTERAGYFRGNVLKGIEWIKSQQEPNGAIGAKFKEFWHPGHSYHHAICGLALAEAYGMARNPDTGARAQAAIDYSINEMQVDYGGWRYEPKKDQDVSVTGWYVMQLKSAKIAGLKMDGKAFTGAISFLDKVTTRPGEVTGDQYGGRVGYTSKGDIAVNPTAIGVLCRLFLGFKRNDANVVGGAEYLMENLPDWQKGGQGGVSKDRYFYFYYYYYGTLAMFQIGGKYWQAWNASMRDMLVGKQRRGGDEDGSWDTIGADGELAGRAYTTAAGALCLEVYYRYLPVHGGQ